MRLHAQPQTFNNHAEGTASVKTTFCRIPSILIAVSMMVCTIPLAYSQPPNAPALSIVDSLYNAAETCMHQGHPERAIPLLRTLITYLKESRDPNEAETAFVCMKLARIYTDIGDYNNAETFLLSAEKHLQNDASTNPDAPPTHKILWSNYFGQLEHNRGNHAKAEALFRSAIVYMIEHGQNKSMLFAITLNNIALALAEQDKLIEAKSCLASALDIVDGIPQAPSSERRAMEENLADLQNRMQKASHVSQTETDPTTE